MPQPTFTQVAHLEYPWKSENLAGAIILVSDQQFTRLANFPDQALEKPAPWSENPISLRDFCKELADAGGTKIHVAYDYFFGGSTRDLYPDTPEFQDNLKKIHDVAREYGLGIEPSVLSPLELGVGYQARTGECGRWMQYGEGLRDTKTGLFSVEVWKHIQWVNNKGPTPVTLAGVRAFAFRETPITGTTFFAIDPQEIIELPTPAIEEYPGTRPVQYGAPEVAENLSRQFLANRVRISGEGLLPAEHDGVMYNRVLVVLIYHTVEMDYFSPSASQFVQDLTNQYIERGIELEGIYSDEMHIQQDWVYHHHHDNGQFTLRYVSPGLERAFAEQYGAQYADFARWMVYFTCHQHHFLSTHEPKLPSQHVFGPGPEDIAATLLFRRNYYHLLEKTVIQLMIGGIERFEKKQGRSLDAFYHSTWAESPTCDLWSVNEVQRDWSPEEHRHKYEYTPDFVWSNTIQQAASACANYFAWNEFLTGGNNDVPEGGYADRNYYGRALACSLAALNRQPLASCGMWGMPAPVADRMLAVSEAYGALGNPIFRSVEDYDPRQIEVLFLYPQDLVAVEERFGSWMVQYGYANYITADKLLQYGSISADGWLEVRGPKITSRYKAVCALYEPFPAPALLDLFERFVEAGGTVVWSSVPPLVGQDGKPAGERFARLFGLEPSALPANTLGMALPGRQVNFSGALAAAEPMPILTHFVVDRVFPVQPAQGSEMVAWLIPGGAAESLCVGARKTYTNNGQAVYLGFRPRDDQSASTGQPVRAWFEILNALGAYPGESNPAVISCSTRFLACAFPNGSVALAPHYTLHEETWPGGFFRDEEVDKQRMEANPLPDDDTIRLEKMAVAGQRVTYRGRHCVAWKRDDAGRLAAFAGLDANQITIDGRTYRWSDRPVDVAWHPLSAEQAAEGYTPLYRVWCGSQGTLRIPLGLKDPRRLELWTGAYIPAGRLPKRAQGITRTPVGFASDKVPFNVEHGDLVIDVGEDCLEHWLYLVECQEE
jgi:hypothetical protein